MAKYTVWECDHCKISAREPKDAEGWIEIKESLPEVRIFLVCPACKITLAMLSVELDSERQRAVRKFFGLERP